REHPEDPRLEVTAVHVLVSGGEIRLARARAASLLAVPKPGSVTAFSTATVLATLGESDKALSVLERAVADRPEEMIYISFDPYLKSLRSKPRFAALTLRIGLPSPGFR